jgi:repressor of nif and glnA expression
MDKFGARLQVESSGGRFGFNGGAGETVETERKILTILKVLSESSEPLGSIHIARQLESHGIYLSERAVRYHLKITDERGFTRPLGRDGRTITSQGVEELRLALASDQVGFVIERIELLAFRTTFSPETRTGRLPVNTTLFAKEDFKRALSAMRPAFDTGLAVSELVTVADEGEKIGNVVVPEGKVGFGTVCSITVNGVLLKAGIPMGSRFGGILEVRNYVPRRFVAIVHYAGSSLDPSEAYMRGGMTRTLEAVTTGNGRILANFREVPAPSKPMVEEIIDKLRVVGIGGVIHIGNTSEAVCQIPVGVNKVGMILLGGLNPVAVAQESGIEAENTGNSGMIDFERLVNFREL